MMSNLAGGSLLAAAKCPSWVKPGKPQCEHMFSALPLRADIAQRSRYVRFVPIAGIRSISAFGPEADFPSTGSG